MAGQKFRFRYAKNSRQTSRRSVNSTSTVQREEVSASQKARRSLGIFLPSTCLRHTMFAISTGIFCVVFPFPLLSNSSSLIGLATSVSCARSAS